ncbi:uncharacterized protein LOC129573074 [Sitodiplosis mosellana]|uniref:uncharacterized protein LOC129573074 n=1 Tax=Sitodiplosis mosellana TaxID=263140 RepID=UPI002443972E|nr:uncharacterized protein LOC129573074 [Sitodiplosis mosellana]
MTLMRNMFNTIMSDSTTMQEHIEEMTNYLVKLNGLGVKAFNEEEIKTALLLSSLPESYRNLVTSLESRDNLTWSIVTSKLMDESKHRSQTSSENDEKLMKIKSKKVKFCTYCKKNFHTVDECRKKMKNKKSQYKVDMIDKKSSENTDEMLLAIHSQKPESSNEAEWNMDSGATSHFSNEKSLFETLKPMNDFVTVANGYKVKVLGIGTCRIHLKNEKGEVTTALLTNVLYAPDLNENFISIKYLTNQRKFKVIFEGEKCKIFLNEREIAVGYLSNDLYYINHQKISAITHRSNQADKCIQVS